MPLDSESTPKAPDLIGKTFSIDTARAGDAVVISLSGELDLASADDLGRLIQRVEETEPPRIVIDLSSLSFIDSTGLQVLLSAKSRSDGRLAFRPPQHDAVTRLLALTRADELLAKS